MSMFHEGSVMTIVDLQGTSLFDVTRGDVLSFIHRSSDIMDSYYPRRVSHVFIDKMIDWF